MKTHVVLTPANIEIEYRLAGAGSRLAAFVIDFTLQIILCLLIAVIILFGIFDYRFATLANLEGYALGFLIISWFTIYFCYFIICELTMNGQSIGKKIFGLRVIRDNGQPIELPQSLIRNLFRAVLDIMYIGLFFILFSQKHKRIGDIIAGTVVIAEHYGSTGAPLRPKAQQIYNRADVDNLTAFAHLKLNTEEQDLLNQYFARKAYLPDAGYSLQQKMAEYLSKKWQIDSAIVDDALLTVILQLNEGKY